MPHGNDYPDISREPDPTEGQGDIPELNAITDIERTAEIMRRNEEAEKKLLAELELQAKQAVAMATVGTPHHVVETYSPDSTPDPLADASEETKQAIKKAADADAKRREEIRLRKEAEAEAAFHQSLEEEARARDAVVHEAGIEEEWDYENKENPVNFDFEVTTHAERKIILVRIFFCGKPVASKAIAAERLYYPEPEVRGKAANSS